VSVEPRGQPVSGLAAATVPTIDLGDDNLAD
jgi:hypothetical protein